MHAPLSSLKFPAIVVVGFGVLTATGAWPPVAGPIWMLTDALAWPMDGTTDFTRPEMRMLLAILGGVLVGWGVTLWALARNVPILRAALFGMVAWFCIDSLGSILAGAASNVLPNIGFLALIVGPILLATRQRATGGVGE